MLPFLHCSFGCFFWPWSRSGQRIKGARTLPFLKSASAWDANPSARTASSWQALQVLERMTASLSGRHVRIRRMFPSPNLSKGPFVRGGSRVRSSANPAPDGLADVKARTKPTILNALRSLPNHRLFVVVELEPLLRGWNVLGACCDNQWSIAGPTNEHSCLPWWMRPPENSD